MESTLSREHISMQGIWHVGMWARKALGTWARKNASHVGLWARKTRNLADTWYQGKIKYNRDMEKPGFLGAGNF